MKARAGSADAREPRGSSGEGVAFLSHMYPGERDGVGGIFIHRTVKALQQAGWPVQVISPVPWAPRVIWFNSRWRSYGQQPRRERFEGVDIDRPRYVTPPVLRLRPFAGATMAVSVRGAVRAARLKGASILHAHCATPDGRAAAIVGRQEGLPVVCSVRGSDIHEYPFRSQSFMKATRKALLAANVVVAVSQALAEQAKAIAGEEIRVEVVYNGVDTRLFRPAPDRDEIRRQWGIPEASRVIAYVGRVERDKGIFELISMFVEVASGLRDTRLLVVGDGAECDAVRSRLAASGLLDRLHWLGRRPPEEVAELLAASDLFCFPSHGEGMPNALLEAMATELPSVATRVGGVPEAIRHGVEGLLVERGDEAALIREVRSLLGDPSARMRMGRAARCRALERFSWVANAAGHGRIYGSILGGGQRS